MRGLVAVFSFASNEVFQMVKRSMGLYIGPQVLIHKGGGISLASQIYIHFALAEDAMGQRPRPMQRRSAASCDA